MIQLSDEDHRKVDAWIKAHHLKCAHTYTGAIGGFYEYWLVPTGIGDFYGARCLLCKENGLDLTDVASL